MWQLRDGAIDMPKTHRRVHENKIQSAAAPYIIQATCGISKMLRLLTIPHNAHVTPHTPHTQHNNTAVHFTLIPPSRTLAVRVAARYLVVRVVGSCLGHISEPNENVYTCACSALCGTLTHRHTDTHARTLNSATFSVDIFSVRAAARHQSEVC